MKRQVCEVFSRVVGYLRPISSWNKGKTAEYGDRKPFIIDRKTKDNKKDSKQKK